MIENIPTSDDFKEQGIWFLNLAWDAVFDLISDFREFVEFSISVLDHDYKECLEYCDSDTDSKFVEFCKEASNDEKYVEEVHNRYWEAAKKPLSVAHALSQQGAELILKAKIAEVSPYLLISNPPKEWPKECDKQNTSFADFRTIDAQDLIRAYHAVSQDKLPGDFVNNFNEFRKTRNAVFHTVDDRLEFSEKKIVTYILDIANICVPKQRPQLRQEYLEASPAAQAIYIDSCNNRLCNEMAMMIKLLGQKKLIELFGFDKKQRRYICPSCYWALERDYDPDYLLTAQLAPNKPDSTNVYCFVCGENRTVIRKDCQEDSCKGNVINTEDDIECLTCFEAQDVEL